MVLIPRLQIASTKDRVADDPDSAPTKLLLTWISATKAQGEDVFSTSLSIYWHKTFIDQRGRYGKQVPSRPPAGAQSVLTHVTIWFLQFPKKSSCCV